MNAAEFGLAAPHTHNVGTHTLDLRQDVRLQSNSLRTKLSTTCPEAGN